MYLNKALVYGNLTRDPEMRALPSGISVATFSIATNRVWNDKNGVKQESADYHNIVVFGRQAEIVNQYLKKGSSALIEGRMQTRSWEADGVKKYRTEIVAERVQFGPRPAGGSSSYNSANKENTKEEKEEIPSIEYPDDDGINPDDIPF
ncbi:single-stranded DNA-binding protein [Candidatus Campbellbacteria bacterium CG22_combo_CG10-13_8_21_14_all_36_13]|uniref:Single-stranded DNA-binding protein n=1 Tax=Candidatus Campbellbacteria bacterium CG22_combo_CG10-13_8_21_14_all_36_13 TaxID=1974529 RepID=A0A2H0DZR6_9BACT|nr:MAG: single-stranded DNA-binding protein [Candidatus Campbellbacteria bacterium CG22_combo_CG10-13_8_21_14_all_36_13]